MLTLVEKFKMTKKEERRKPINKVVVQYFVSMS